MDPPVTTMSDYLRARGAWVQRNPLRQWRNSQDTRISTVVAASLLGVTVTAVQQWEHGVWRPAFADRPLLVALLDPDVEARWDAWLADRPSTPSSVRPDRET